jgi:TrmH family RNA methyltransferase
MASNDIARGRRSAHARLEPRVSVRAERVATRGAAVTSSPTSGGRSDKRDLGSERRLALPIHARTRFVLVHPHYPENVGAAARAIKTMGFSELWLVKPGRLALPDHEMAQKMAVKSWDVLDSARICTDAGDAVRGATLIAATTSRRGVSHVVSPRAFAARSVEHAAAGEHIAILFGNEKSGLSDADRDVARVFVRIPMVADQPSINLAQAVQLVAYELYVAALDARARDATGEEP